MMIHHPSPNYDTRADGHAINMIVLHYTNMPDAQSALARLCDASAKVSAHYLIDEAGAIFALVDEDKRAWHAGRACWRGVQDINSCSLGIELAHCGADEAGRLAAFPPAQMQALLALLRDIETRHKIPPARFLGHSDVAPLRKQDPGETFDWRWLAEQGFGLFSDAAGDKTHSFTPEDFQQALYEHGYCLPLASQSQADDITAEQADDAPHKTEYALQKTTLAFQRHFRPEKLDGRMDAQCYARLLDLLRQAR